MDAVDTLQILAECEINFLISYFYDQGYTFKLGDELNGFLDDGLFEDFEEGAKWLWNSAQKHFPEAECFA